MNQLKCFLLCLVFPALAWAHGGEDHSHDEAAVAQTTVSGQARLETATDLFELVGQLNGDEFSILIDRYDSNEPVADATVEVEVNGVKAQATYHADHGDYAVDDAALLNELARPGRHALVFTVSAGDDADLLEGTLQVDEAAHAAHAAPSATAAGALGALPLSTVAIIAAVLTIALAAAAIGLARRAPSTGKQP